MASLKKYSTPRAFRNALETRLQNIAKNEKMDLQRLRRMVAFDRLLARLVVNNQMQWVLKGGYAMELRIKRARATKDIDLTIEHYPWELFPNDSLKDIMREELQKDVCKEMGDNFVFLVGLASMNIDAAPYGGARYPIDAKLDGRTFVKFHVDIGVGDEMIEPIETITTRDWLGFAGIKPPFVKLLSKEQQFSEKLHAYTLPDRSTTNSRVKDLVDMVLLIKHGNLEPKKVQLSLNATFVKRKTHQLPKILNLPPSQWKPIFEKLAMSCALNENIEDAFYMLKVFYSECL